MEKKPLLLYYQDTALLHLQPTLHINIERLFPHFLPKYAAVQRVLSMGVNDKYPADQFWSAASGLVNRGTTPSYVLYYTPNKIYSTEIKRDKLGVAGRREFGVNSYSSSGAMCSLISTGWMDKDTLIDRLIKVTLHEVGHLSGATHCNNKRCVMNMPQDFSTPDNLDHLDNETSFYLCGPCDKRIKSKMGLLEVA